jgi:hypothetical protein
MRFVLVFADAIAAAAIQSRPLGGQDVVTNSGAASR